MIQASLVVGIWAFLNTLYKGPLSFVRDKRFPFTAHAFVQNKLFYSRHSCRRAWLVMCTARLGPKAPALAWLETAPAYLWLKPGRPLRPWPGSGLALAQAPAQLTKSTAPSKSHFWLFLAEIWFHHILWTHLRGAYWRNSGLGDLEETTGDKLKWAIFVLLRHRVPQFGR